MTMKPRTLGMVLIAVALICGLIGQFRSHIEFSDLVSFAVDLHR